MDATMSYDSFEWTAPVIEKDDGLCVRRSLDVSM